MSYRDDKILSSEARVLRQYAVSGAVQDQEEESEALRVHQFITAPAQVGLTMAMTVNLGNYESVKISVSLSVPCYKEEQDAAYEFARKWVEERTLKELGEAKQFAAARKRAKDQQDDPF